MPRLCTLAPHHLEICDNTLRERGLIAPNKALLAAIIIKDPKLVRLLITGYPKRIAIHWKDRKTPPILDTYDREHLLDVISNEYTDMVWPCNCDSDDYIKEFTSKLVERASQSGWVFNS